MRLAAEGEAVPSEHGAPVRPVAAVPRRAVRPQTCCIPSISYQLYFAMLAAALFPPGHPTRCSSPDSSAHLPERSVSPASNHCRTGSLNSFISTYKKAAG
ncbi:hypothetical protein GN956_G416 [Arapaima gigas]